MLKGLSSVGTGTIESLRIVSKAIQAVTVTSIDLTREAQSEAMNLNERLVNQLEDLTTLSTQEEVTDVSVNILNSIESTFKVSHVFLHIIFLTVLYLILRFCSEVCLNYG